MASKYEISAVFKLIDKITTPLDKVGKSGKAVGKALKRDFMAAEDSLNKFGKRLKKIGGYAIGAGIAAAGAGIAIATKQFIEFDAAATAATAKFKDLDVTSDTYAESLKKVGQAARDVAAITEFNAVDTAGALDKMAMAGLTSEQSMKLLKGTTDLATAAGMDLTTAVDIATDSLGAFGLMTKDASQLQTNLNRVSDVMAKTTNMFNTDMPLMFESIKKGGPAFTSAGQSMESFSALIGVMASSGVKGSEAGTQLRNMMLSLANPSDAADRALKRLGVTVKDQNGNFLDIIDIMAQFEAGTKNMGSAEKAAALATIFGTRTVTGMNIVLQEGADKLRAYRADLENAGGSAANIAAAMRGSIKNKIEILKSALTELGFKFVEAFQEKGVGLIEKLTDAVAKFDPQPVIDAVVTAGNAIGGIIKIVWELHYFILGLAIAWGAYKAAMLVGAAVAPILTLIKAIQMLASGQKLATVAQWAFNAAANANPIGIIITAIGILIGLIILAVKHWDKVTAAVSYAGEWIKYVALLIRDGLCSAFSSLAGFISDNSEKALFFISIFTGPFGLVLSMANELRENWGMVVETFKTDGIIAGLKRLGGVLLSGLLAPVQGFLEMLSKIPMLGEKMAPAVEKIEAFRNQLKGIDETAPVEAVPEKATQPRPRRVRPVLPAALRPAAPVDEAAAFPPAARAPASPVNAVPPQITAPAASVNTALGTAAPRVVNQPAFLQLQNPIPGGEMATQPSAGPASPWSVPVTHTGGTMPDITEAASIPAKFYIGDYNIDAASANAVPPQIARPASVPVKYEFPELIVPPELIRPATVPAQWSAPTMPEPPQERRSRAATEAPPVFTRRGSPRREFPSRGINTPVLGLPGRPAGRPRPAAAAGTASRRITRPVPAQAGRLVPQAVAHNDPARVDRIVPPAARTAITGTAAEAMTPQAPPMTRAEQITAEQIINSRTEHKETVNVRISLDKGLQAKAVNPPKSPNVRLEISGDA
jgi:TP901 family phage tail tape measure protein